MALEAGQQQENLHARVLGSGFTWFKFRNHVVSFAQSIGVQSPAPVADPQPIQPLNYRRPVEIVVPRAIGPGTLTCTAIELWNQPAWQRLVGLGDAADLADVFQLMWNAGTADLQANVVVDPPIGRGSGGRKYIRTYHGIKVTNIDDGEQIDITTMTAGKPITFMYTHSTRTGVDLKFPSRIDTGNN